MEVASSMSLDVRWALLVLRERRSWAGEVGDVECNWAKSSWSESSAAGATPGDAGEAGE